jgi:hypothetical protein
MTKVLKVIGWGLLGAIAGSLLSNGVGYLLITDANAGGLTQQEQDDLMAISAVIWLLCIVLAV